MRINKFIAQATGLARRKVDIAIQHGRVTVNGQPAKTGQAVGLGDLIVFDGQPLVLNRPVQTIMLNKPVGYVCSRDGQGSKTVYDLLPADLHHLKPVGRLDKDSSGLLLLTNDGELSNKLTHPSFEKTKIYEVEINRALITDDFARIVVEGVRLDDGLSKLELSRVGSNVGKQWNVKMHEGRNRQIRRTFAALGYKVVKLHRIKFGKYELAALLPSKYVKV